jgi:cell division protease FtsH
MQQNKKNSQNPKKQPNAPKLPKMKRSQTITFWIVLLLFIVVVFQMSRMNSTKNKNITYSQFEDFYKNKMVRSIQINDRDVTLLLEDGQKLFVYLPFDPDANFVKELSSQGINVNSQKPSKMLGILLSWFPFLIFIGIWIFLMRGMRGGAGQAFSFGKSRAKLASLFRMWQVSMKPKKNWKRSWSS